MRPPQRAGTQHGSGHRPRPPASDPHALFVKPDQPAAATSSWWLGCADRDVFRARAEAERERMRHSRFAQYLTLLTKSTAGN